MQKITPFIWFEKNNAEEAMNFYVSVFKNAKIVEISRYPEGMTEEHMKNMGGKVLTGIFELDGQQFMCIDGGPGVFQLSGAISFLVTCEDQAEIDHYWEKLSAVPEAEQCGWLKDKFGVTWQIVPKGMGEMLNGPDKEKTKRAMQAMFQMKKIDIATLLNA
ncbi:MAG: VOC family protein [Patescibacteria group bacterium]|jgi:predicted 3-demethylubiquinone-9 3-methyltransferase (glyoxalase superfamily)